ITLLGRNPFEMIKGEWYTEKDPGYVVTDNYYAPNQITVTVDTSGLNTKVGGEYFVYYKAMDASGNQSELEFRSVFVNFITGIKNNSETRNGVQIYPNPSSGNIKLYSNEPILHIAVYDTNGKLHQVLERPELGVDIRIKAQGLLFVHIKTESGLSVQKLLVTH
ncbi:MAG: T9SS type A sorting domain-containing protein, partial [Bacteroidota bacterium]